MPKIVADRNRIKDTMVGLKAHQKDFLKNLSKRSGISVSQIIRSLINKKIREVKSRNE